MRVSVLTVVAAAIALSACTQAPQAAPPSVSAPLGDSMLVALQNAHPNNCPPGRVQANARSEGFGDFRGVTIEDVASVPMSGSPTRVLTLQRVTVAPNGVIGWHAHAGGQGMALLVSGTVTEARNDCLDTIAFKPGDVTLEKADTAHGFRNDGATPAVFLVWSGAPAPSEGK